MPAAVLPDLTSSLDALRSAGIHVSALFGPEHGFGGAALDGAHVADATDPRTGLPVYSLYGATNEPTAEMLANVDALVFDMQDVGVRFYTYLSTLFHVLRGAGKADKPVFVLDRPDPITGSHHRRRADHARVRVVRGYHQYSDAPRYDAWRVVALYERGI